MKQHTAVLLFMLFGLMLGSMSGFSNIITTTTTAAAPMRQDINADPVFVGAGDIAECNTTRDSDTANLLDKISGTVYTAGDNAYNDGTNSDFNNCYDSIWGRHKSRT
ncbi:MAG: hypothetical protein MI924_25955 [Chloroflexales bacterium]|nr:hypothetical protein [Chloroflexales bacterium]